MKICMIGVGYVGLVSGASFAEFGHNVFCVDTDKDKIKKLKNGVMPIFEPGLERLVKVTSSTGRLAFHYSIKEVIKEVDLIFIAVGTPERRTDGQQDLTYLMQAVHELRNYLSET